MKKLLALCSLPLAVLAFSVACDTGNAVDCVDDADCEAGEVCAPVSDVDESLICQANNDECTENADCQIGFNNSGGTLEANPACDASTDCADGEICATGFNGEGSCVLGGACPDGAAGAATITVDLADGGTGEACVDEGSTCTDGTCEA